MVRRKLSHENARNNTLDSSRLVTFKREVLVPNPTNKFENQRFGIELSDTRNPSETYAEVYNRLREAGMRILADDIHAYVNGTRQHVFDVEHNEIRKKYSLF